MFLYCKPGRVQVYTHLSEYHRHYVSESEPLSEFLIEMEWIDFTDKFIVSEIGVLIYLKSQWSEFSTHFDFIATFSSIRTRPTIL